MHTLRVFQECVCLPNELYYYDGIAFHTLLRTNISPQNKPHSHYIQSDELEERYKHNQSNIHKNIPNHYDGNFQPNVHSNQIPGSDFNSPHAYIEPNLMPSNAYFSQGDKK